jgi:hypothetical protein
LEHGHLEHGRGKVYQENLLVPLVVRAPAVEEQLFVDVPVSGLDIAPTLLALAGLDAASAFGYPLLGTDLLALAGSDDLLDRQRFAHGFHSSAGLDEEYLRWGHGDWALILDRRRDQTELTDRRGAEGKGRSEVAASEDLETGMRRILAWLGATDYSVRLPSASQIKIPATADIADVQLVSGLGLETAARAADGSWTSDLSTPAEWLLFRAHEKTPTPFALDLTSRGEPRRLEVDIDQALSGASWNPLESSDPPPGTVFRGATRIKTTRIGLDAEQRAELEALGYL